MSHRALVGMFHSASDPGDDGPGAVKCSQCKDGHHDKCWGDAYARCPCKLSHFICVTCGKYVPPHDPNHGLCEGCAKREVA